jgi:4-diphosphocytidyl-2-C-methyl-D-erythritol kinase
MGFQQENGAVYAALSGSGSALFGLFRSVADADAAQQRVEALRLQQHGVQAIVTSTMPRSMYWSDMFAE